MKKIRYFYPEKEKRSILEFLKKLGVTGWIIFTSIIISVVFFIVNFSNPENIRYFALQPNNILSGNYLWTLLTHIFIHGNIFHLFINMFVLFSLGGLCERIIGRKRYFWFYLISGVFAGLLSAVLAGLYGFDFWEKVFGSPEVYMVGASGAIFAIAGLFVVLLPRLKFSIIFLPFISFPAYIIVPVILVITWLASLAASLPIGNVAHFGGFLAGITYGYYLRTTYRKKIMILQRLFK